MDKGFCHQEIERKTRKERKTEREKEEKKDIELIYHPHFAGFLCPEESNSSFVLPEVEQKL